MSDDRQEPPAGDADATRAFPRDVPGGDSDATRAFPRDAARADADATRAMPRDAARTDADATRPLPGGARPPLDATARSEPVGGGAWSGRAGVPPPRPAGYVEPGGEWYGNEPSGRRWWMPILLGILALVLLGLIGAGVWWALRASERNSDPEAPGPSGVPSTSAQTSAAPTSAAPSSAPPSTPPATTAGVRVPMPPLVGLPESVARAALDRLDVDYRVQRRPSDRPAGTVIATDPDAGYPVGEGARVTVVVAEPERPTVGASTPRSGPPTTNTPTP
ncbi:PASTA domain-containing protein [Micromonospora sp. DT31]|uniref:PASTA domain-containing protein n=1 Tax=Micromonospora sp. DT31 TaxID=3393434 RepID=UPI003CFAD19B